MVTYLIFTALFNGLLILFASKLYRNLHPFEIFNNWVFTAGLVEIFKFIVFLNHHWIQTGAGTLLFWTLEMDRLVFIPFCTVWLFDLYGMKRLSPAGKILLTPGWFLTLIGFQYLNKTLGYFRFSGWNAVNSAVEWLILYALVAGMAVLCRTFLKKEALLT